MGFIRRKFYQESRAWAMIFCMFTKQNAGGEKATDCVVKDG
jgi:hypothetical protein